MRLITTAVVLSSFASLASEQSARAQTPADLYPELQTVTMPTGTVAERFGEAIALSGDTMAVGVRYNLADGKPAPGSVQVFVRSGALWVLQQVLTASNGEVDDEFGASVVLAGDTLVVGAPKDDVDGVADRGSLRVFERIGSTWSERQTLTSPGTDGLGRCVALSGNVLAAGVPDDDIGGNQDQGTVRIFEWNGTEWTFVTGLLAGDGQAGDFLGSSVALSGDTLLVTAFGDDVGGAANQGSVRTFLRQSDGSWVAQQTLTASDGAAGDRFGIAIALAGDTLAVTAPTDDVNGITDKGSVRIFGRTGGVWSEQATLTAPGSAAMELGESVALSGDTLVVGAPYEAVGGFVEQGSVRIFTRSGTTWTHRLMLTASDGEAEDFFGYPVVLDNGVLAVGASFDDVEPDIDEGSVRLFGNGWIKNATRDTLHPSLASAVAAGFWGDRFIVGARAFAGASGIIDASDKRFTFTAVEPLTLGPTALMQVATGTVFEKSPAVSAGGLSVAGKLVAPESGTLTFEELSVAGLGQFVQRGSTVLVNQALAASAGGVCYLEGEVLAETVSTAAGGQNRVAGDTDVFANYNNAGATVIQRGILYIYGTLTNTGTITGEFNNGFLPPNPGDGYSVGGDYIVSAESSIVLPDPVWWLRIGGGFDVAIDSPSRFVMDQATLELSGVGPKGGQSVEVLSRDLGDAEAGFANTNYPLGAMRLRAGATVELVDNHDNAPGKAAEAVYAKNLVVPAGATLVTNGLKVYTRAATIQGAVSDPDDIIVVPGVPPCAADLFPDGVVAGSDLTILLERWGPCTASCIADIDRDGQVGSTDLAILLSSWGPCAD